MGGQLVVYPLCGATTTAAALTALERAVADAAWSVELLEISGWHPDPAYLALRAEGIRAVADAHTLDLEKLPQNAPAVRTAPTPPTVRPWRATCESRAARSTHWTEGVRTRRIAMDSVQGMAGKEVRESRRIGFATKVLGRENMRSHDARRWQSDPSVQISVEALYRVLDYVSEIGIRMYRMSSNFVPYATHRTFPSSTDSCRITHRSSGGWADTRGART